MLDKACSTDGGLLLPSTGSFGKSTTFTVLIQITAHWLIQYQKWNICISVDSFRFKKFISPVYIYIYNKHYFYFLHSSIVWVWDDNLEHSRSPAPSRSTVIGQLGKQEIKTSMVPPRYSLDALIAACTNSWKQGLH